MCVNYRKTILAELLDDRLKELVDEVSACQDQQDFQPCLLVTVDARGSERHSRSSTWLHRRVMWRSRMLPGRERTVRASDHPVGETQSAAARFRCRSDKGHTARGSAEEVTHCAKLDGETEPIMLADLLRSAWSASSKWT